MEIIDELENKKEIICRGVGYFSGNGDMDTCIALRTALIKNKNLCSGRAGIVLIVFLKRISRNNK